MIRYVKGDATHPVGEGNKLIVHCCNDVGAWGAGFVLAISKLWPEPEIFFKRASKLGNLELGDIQLVRVENDITVANLVGQHGVYHPTYNVLPLQHEALALGFLRIAEHAKTINASIHMPRIGCGLAGGKWELVEPLINEFLAGLSVTVYDL